MEGGWGQNKRAVGLLRGRSKKKKVYWGEIYGVIFMREIKQILLPGDPRLPLEDPGDPGGPLPTGEPGGPPPPNGELGIWPW